MPRNGLPRGSETPREYFELALANYQEAAAELAIEAVHIKREERPAVYLQLAQTQALLGLLAAHLLDRSPTPAYDPS